MLLQSTEFYKLLDRLPSIPECFVQEAMDICNGKNPQTQINHRYSTHLYEQNEYDNSAKVLKLQRQYTKNGKLESSRPVPRYAISSEFEQWLSKNIVKEFVNAGVSSSLDPYDGSSSSHTVAHADSDRDYVLLYPLLRDNPDQYTVFYQESGFPQRRDPSYFCKDVDRLQELDRICLPLNQWSLFDALVLHGVDNVKGRRIAIQVSLNREQFNLLSSKFQYK